MSGVPVVEAAAWLGHSPIEHVKTYAHATLIDRGELDYQALLLDRQRSERERRADGRPEPRAVTR